MIKSYTLIGSDVFHQRGVAGLTPDIFSFTDTLSGVKYKIVLNPSEYVSRVEWRDEYVDKPLLYVKCVDVYRDESCSELVSKSRSLAYLVGKKMFVYSPSANADGCIIL